MNNFLTQQKEEMINWRKANISSQESGIVKGKKYEHIIPENNWTDNLWPEIAREVSEYLRKNQIQHHSGSNNLLSSWVLCANLYFPLRNNASLRDLMTDFLKTEISDQISEIENVELEFAFPSDHKLNPLYLLGEADGKRGASQTSPDIAIEVKTQSGNGIILIESKYTEHSFYPCSARRTIDNSERKGNPDPSRCFKQPDLIKYKEVCHQTTWGRKYWENLQLSPSVTLSRCPAATAGYQLFRQQALAEGIANSGLYSLVVSAVAYDARNEQLIKSLSRTGINDFTKGWSDLFVGKTLFKTWTHQKWVSFVRENQKGHEFDSWLEYLKTRYSY